MANTPQWKVYRDGEYVAAMKYPEDAAALIGAAGGVVKYNHKLIVWIEGAEEIPAQESFDRAGAFMRERRDAFIVAADKRRLTREAAVKADLARPHSMTIRGR